MIMTWSSSMNNKNSDDDDDDEEDISLKQIVSSSAAKEENCTTVDDQQSSSSSTIICSSCGHTIKLQDHHQTTGLEELPGLPAGVKFDPSDQEILQHLDAKVLSDADKLHPLIDKFIPTIDGENGICYTHPEKLPGRSSAAFLPQAIKSIYNGTRKRRKVHTDEDGSETRWHKTGKTRPILASCNNNNNLKGYKKILVLYTNYGRQKKPEKTNWVMHQYHLGDNEEEKDGELVVSKVFYQTQPRQCGSSSISSKSISSSSKGTIDRSPFMNNASFVEYYNPPFVSYNIEGQNTNRDSPSPMIPNMVVHGDGSSFIRLPSNASKAK